jgi:hypothetical protein
MLTKELVRNLWYALLLRLVVVCKKGALLIETA